MPASGPALSFTLQDVLPQPVACLRCGVGDESLHHRLRACPANLRWRHALDQDIGHNALHAGLPVCVARAGLAPRGYAALSSAQTAWLLTYLRGVSADAIQRMARHHRNLGARAGIRP